MLKEIELAITEQLNSRIEGIRQAVIKTAGTALAGPTLFVECGGASYEKLTMTTFKAKTEIWLVLEFRAVRSEMTRRHGAYPILEAVVSDLLFADLALGIEPLKPKEWKNITGKESEAGTEQYLIVFTTSYTVTRMEEELIDDWLRIGLNYYLQDPVDDEVVDASDLVELEE